MECRSWLYNTGGFFRHFRGCFITRSNDGCYSGTASAIRVRGDDSLLGASPVSCPLTYRYRVQSCGFTHCLFAWLDGSLLGQNGLARYQCGGDLRRRRARHGSWQVCGRDLLAGITGGLVGCVVSPGVWKCRRSLRVSGQWERTGRTSFRQWRLHLRLMILTLTTYTTAGGSPQSEALGQLHES